MDHLITIQGELLDLGRPRIMGILNATPDSFYTKSRLNNSPDLEERILQVINDGPDIMDVGGYSTRPGASDISEAEELNRVLPVIEKIVTIAPQIPLSIDTFRSNVAKEAVMAGASIINDVSGGNLDPHMFQMVVDLEVPYILGHMRGNPRTMGKFTNYEDLLLEVLTELQAKTYALQKMGLKDIIIDPGFGFAKSSKQSLSLLQDLEQFKLLDLPVMVGISRKSMIWKTLETDANKSLNGTSVLNTLAFIKGAKILRVHDVKEAIEVRKLLILNDLAN